MADVRLSVRPAASSDVDLLLAWRNDPLSREMSREHGEVAPEAHAGWLDRSLTDPDRVLLVGQDGTTPVGTVRFDRGDTPDVWVVSITVAPEQRGRGVATPLLEAGWHHLTSHHPVTRVEAGIRVTNAASRRAFERAGYTLDGDDGAWLSMSRHVTEPVAGS